MKFCVGTVGLSAATPVGLFHAVRTNEASNGVALCGARVQAWAPIEFPSAESGVACEICRFAVDYETS